MTALTVPVLILALLAVAGAAGLRALLGLAESRRQVRWSHTLARFCGDPACGLCRSRRLSRTAARQIPGRAAWLASG